MYLVDTNVWLERLLISFCALFLGTVGNLLSRTCQAIVPFVKRPDLRE